MFARRKFWITVQVVLLVYVSAYLGLSRRGYAEARQYIIQGFYYFTPRPTKTWRYCNYTCVYLFSPLNLIDRALGQGMCPAKEPLWGLSK
jgi:hypothetical protein